MPETTITIDRDRRDGLYEVISNHLALIEDFWVAMERTKDFATAERLGLEFAEDFCLLRDIGWAEDEDRERFDLTMPSHDLSELLQRLRGEAVGILVESGTDAQASREDTETESPQGRRPLGRGAGLAEEDGRLGNLRASFGTGQRSDGGRHLRRPRGPSPVLGDPGPRPAGLGESDRRWEPCWRLSSKSRSSPRPASGSPASRRSSLPWPWARSSRRWRRSRNRRSIQPGVVSPG
jgi:hypothetical protein